MANLAKIDQFCVDMTSVGERFCIRDNHLLFQQQFAPREMREMLKQLTLWLVPSFSQRSSKNAW